MNFLRGRMTNIGPAVQYYAWRAVAAIVGRMPLRMAYGVATALGTVGYYAWPRGRRSMMANYGVVMPRASKAERGRVARQSLGNYCKYLVDFVRFPNLPTDDVLRHVKGEAHYQELRRVIDGGRGAVVVCMHFGNWDAGAGATAARGFPVTVVAESFADPRLDAMVSGARERLGMRVVKLEKLGPSLLRTLKSGGVLALLVDRPMEGDGVGVTFFGREIEVPAGPARLALRSGAKVIPTAFPRLDPNRPEVDTLCDWSIEPPCTGDAEEDIRLVSQAIINAHEGFIRSHPEQWYMFRRMWPRPASRPEQ